MREALLAFAAAPFAPQPLPPVDSWEEVLHRAWLHGLTPLAHRAVAASDWDPAAKAQARQRASSSALHSKTQERLHARVLQSLAEAAVPTMVLKGPGLARTVYPVSSLRPSGDLDVLVPQDAWRTVRDALSRLGYTSLQPLTEPPPKVAQHKAYYHTQYVNTERDHMVEIHYDMWWYGLRPALGPVYWQRALPLEIGGAPTQMPSFEDMLLHCCIHLHHHGYNRLIWFTDLAMLIRSRGAQLDWQHLVHAARTEGLGIFVYYSLTYLERLLGVASPGWVLDALRPSFLQAWVHDALCPPQAVLAVEVTDRAVFDFHEVPEFTELVLNFVLTGRRWEKLTYLARLFAPSDEWLAYYYATTDPRILRRRRWTHGPSLLLKGLREALTTARHGAVRQPLA